MAALIIQKNPDGSVSISAPAQIPPELLQDAQQVGSVEEAAQVVSDVLGEDSDPSNQPVDGTMGEDGQIVGGEEPQEPQAAGPATPEDDEEAAMQGGFDNARKGR